MNIKSIDLNLLKVFHALYEKPNVSAAAKSLGLSQPAVSHALQRLRDTFHDPLFVRAPKGVVPTARAHELGPTIIRLFAELEISLEKKVFDPKLDDGLLRIKGTDYFEQTILPSFVSRLRNEAPNMRLISQSNQGVLPKLELEQGLIDIAVAGFFEELPNGFYKQKIFEDKLVGLCCHKHPYLKKKGLREYTKWPQMVISPEGKLEGIIDRALQRDKKSRPVVTSISSFMPSGWIVQDTDLLLALPGKLAKQLSQILKVTVFELPLDLPPIEIVQVWHETAHLNPRHQWLRKQLFDVCQLK